MAQSLIEMYAHIILSTRNREKIMEYNDLRKIHSYIGALINNNNCQTIIIGGTSNHLHILCKLASAASIAMLMQALKRNACKWIKTLGPAYENFSWQHGYEVFSVSLSEVEELKQYIENQELYHQEHSFKEEFVEILTKNLIESPLEYY